MLVTVGGSEAIDVALRCMVDPGDEVLIPQPSYVSYLPCAVMADAVPVFINLKEENQFKLTKEELLEHITDKTKILIMPFSNNPTVTSTCFIGSYCVSYFLATYLLISCLNSLSPALEV